MKTYDWIVIGGGITGAALSYELTKKGFEVLLLEQYGNHALQNATRYSYGGLAYWSGTTELTRQLCAEGIDRNRILSQELDIDTQFRELDLILTVDVDDDPKKMAAAYSNCAIPPRLLSIEEACAIEPLLNPDAISGALTVKHGYINPQLTAEGYCQAAIRAGGERQIGRVLGFIQEGDRILGVKTNAETYHSANVVVCAGGFSRQLLKDAGISARLYFTHAEVIETPPVDIQLNTLVMPAQMKRFQLEAQASTLEIDNLWDEPGHEPVPPILDAGMVQFKDGTIRLGQISRALTDPSAKIDPLASEAAIRAQVGKVLPALGKLPGTWHHCLVAFSHNRLPIVGKLPGVQGVYIFSGFSNPLVFVPPLAQRFAAHCAGEEDPIVDRLAIAF
ncbi:NAD(P)/FAD-dependent oxidoreductase [Argonema antarcticum]|uniref:NAD(P)/FAD-dependent oxidoreductase n=1 Tax=Argonema antarcticum TaxID=2942763 RepID=UPI0020138A06|nr:FAD-binding oxidoreductase [Argonema antarcticum]MCL1471541.1 FAD-binding oxidoreductase [Argonema antarcticum A004/B2]